MYGLPAQVPINNPADGVEATLMIFFGQSNAKGWSTDPTNSTALSQGYGYEFYPSGSSGVILPLGFNLMGRTQGGPQRAVAQTWAAAGGGVVICVDAAVNGCTLTKNAKSALTGSGVSLSGGTFDLTDAANLYDAWVKTLVQSAIQVAATRGFNIKKRVVMFVQGESDGGANALTNGPDYRTAMVALIDKWVADFQINAFVVSKLGTPSTGTTAFWDAIRTAQVNAVSDRSSIAVVGFTDAENFAGAGKMVDTLHYTQTGYNEMGIGLATAGLSFLGGMSLRSPPLSKFNEIKARFPAISGWKRIIVDHTCTGTFGMAFTSDPTTPAASTWVDGSGLNSQSAEATLTWSFTGTTGSKNACLYVSDTITSSGNITGGANCNISVMRIADSGVKIHTINMGSSGAITAGFRLPDLLSFDGATARAMQFSTASAVEFTDAVLDSMTGLTSLIVSGSSTRLLDVTKIANCTRLDMVNCSLSVSDVNTILIALDANGKNNGLTQLSQTPSAAPSGAGATAKTSLQGKGWTVSTN